MYTSTAKRKLNRHATTVLIGGIFLFLSVMLYLGLCALPCEVRSDEDIVQRAELHEGEKPFWNRPSNLVKKKLEAFLVVVILTGPKYFKRRQAIRETWLSDVPDHVLKWFAIGTRDLPSEEVKTLQYEHTEHSDLLLLPDLTDSYYNLTTKVIAVMSWLDQNVNFKFLLKADDDTYARTDVIYNELQDKPTERLYWGFFYGRGTVYRSGKWAEKDWVLCDKYLPYARGGGYVLSADIVRYIARNSQFLMRFNSEDVSVGAWLAPLDIQRLHDPRFDTEYKSRGCNNAYIVTHKQDISSINEKYANIKESGKLCAEEFQVMKSYIYNWDVAPSQCCIRNNSYIP